LKTLTFALFYVSKQVSYMDAERWCSLKGRLTKNIRDYLDFETLMAAIVTYTPGL
jgi:hypothetical protein